MRTAFIINLSSFGFLFIGFVIAMFFGVERVNARMQEFPLWLVFNIPFLVFAVSAMYLLFESWVMLLRSWKRRDGSENLKLLLLLFFFHFLASYYFYKKRYDIDPQAP